MAGRLYNKEYECPICSREFSSMHVRNSKTILDDRDSDFCPYYKEEPPFFYTPIVCPKCGYADSKDRFEDIPDREKVKVIKNVSEDWSGANYGGPRDAKTAAKSYKQALENARAREQKASVKGPLYLRRAWCYRHLDSHRETRMLREARKFYKQAYEEEKNFAGNLDEITVLYLVGELYRRTGQPEEAVQWFSRVVEHPKRLQNQKLENMARDQWQQAKEDKEAAS